MKSQTNIGPNAYSPKFSRRSMSPVQFINTEEYKTKLRSRDIQVNFAYLPDKKLEKVGIKKRGLRNSKLSLQRTDSVFLDKLDNHIGSENSFLKYTDISSFQRCQGKFTNQPTNDTDILRSLDEDSDSLQAQLNIHSELYNAQKKIFELETELENKNRKIQQQSEQIRKSEIQHSESMNKIKYYENQLQKANIKMRMDQRKTQQQANQIRKLKAINWMRRDRIYEMQRDERLRLKKDDFFDLSPEKGQ